MKNALIALALLTGLTASPSNAKSETTGDIDSLQGGWQLTSVNGQDYQSEHPLNFTIQGSQMMGSDGCNRMNGQYQIKNNNLSSRLATTRKMCMSAEVMELAASFHRLSQSAEISFKGQTLILASNETIMTFTPKLENASDSQGHGPDAGTLESVGALVWQGKTDQAIREVFWMASKSGGHDIPLQQIKMSDDSKEYLTNEHAYMTLSGVLFSAVQRKKPDLTQEKWQRLWQNAPHQGTLQNWAGFVNSFPKQ